jgi:hypothetical protein
LFGPSNKRRRSGRQDFIGVPARQYGRRHKIQVRRLGPRFD